MRTTIDAAGRVVVPKAIRDHLHLHGGVEVEIRERDGRVEIVPAPAELDVVEGPGGPVAVPRESIPALTDDLVRATVDAVRR